MKNMIPKALIILLALILVAVCFTACWLRPGANDSSAPDNQPKPPSRTGTIPGGGGEVSGGSDTLFSFTPDTSGVWIFEVVLDGDGGGGLELFGPDGDSITKSVSNEYLEAGNTYTLLMTIWRYPNTRPISFTLTVSPAIKIPGGGGEMRVDKDIVFSFTPDTSGTWNFLTSDNDGVETYININDSGARLVSGYDSGLYSDDGNSFVSLELEKGEIYRIGAGLYPGGSGSFTLTVSFDD